MNARQIKKCLKKRINRLESDNNLMRRIIANSHDMQTLYDLYNMPFNVQHTTMQFQELKVKRIIYDFAADLDENGIVEDTKQLLANDLFYHGVKDYITYEIDTESTVPTITASIFVSRK